jgi:hypothetical protein
VFFGAGIAHPCNRVKALGGDTECGNVFLVNGSQNPVVPLVEKRAAFIVHIMAACAGNGGGAGLLFFLPLEWTSR